MITVAHVITKLELGGAQENTLHTVAGLDRARFRVVLIYGPGGELDGDARRILDLEHVVVPHLVREVHPTKDAVGLAKLRGVFSALLAKDRGLLVHTHSSKAGILGRLAAASAGESRIVHGIHGFGFHDGQSRVQRAVFVQAERMAARVTDAFVSVSEASLAEARAEDIVRPHHRALVIRSGMDLARFAKAAPARRATREALGIQPDDELILAVANFKPQKDPLTLIEAMRRLARDRPRARLAIAGDGELRKDVENAIRVGGLRDRVQLLGWRRDIPELMAACDLVALSSIFEGLPRSAVQAVAARRPFVGTRVDGTPEIIRDGKNGFLVPPRDPEALARALKLGLLIRPIDREDLARLEAWDETRMVRAQEALYEELANGPGHAR